LEANIFKPFLHVERFGNEEVTNIELGECFVFPKIDGSNASIWATPVEGSSEPLLCFGSRTRQLSLESDNAGFMRAMLEPEPSKRLLAFFKQHPTHRLYGEWLVPHTLKTYREDAWRRFWIFDVFNDATDQFISYYGYKQWLTDACLDYVDPLAIIRNGSYDNFIHILEQNNFYIQDGKGLGEGIVIKNYEFYNRFARPAQAKIVRSEFKEMHHREMGAPERDSKMVEELIAERYCTKALCEKVQAKIIAEEGGAWSSKFIPRLLETCYYDVIREETWEFLKEHKQPTINFGALKHLIFKQIKSHLTSVF